ncbi:hypothetical protein BJY01DRAFT_246714 [Aspergillus pseudoustus]|uniref:F-box domain-containing protein n=1 Tax=Aspergillus pseudoustus TaxID=1810923 RepID=A0ABR4K926_9EURO
MPAFLRRATRDVLWISARNEFTRCILCGGPTARPYPAWMDVVRILYPRGNKIVLSDLYSKHHESSLGIRSDPMIEWEDRPDPWNTKADACWSSGSYFMLHESCWQYAVVCFGTDMPKLEDFFDVLRELPRPKDPACLHPTDYQPCAFPRVHELDGFARSYPEPAECRREEINHHNNPSDKFQRLPLELRQAIALGVSISDLLNTRYASRAMAEVFNDNSYWKQMVRNRGFQDYIPHEAGQIQGFDWRLLYHVGSRIQNKFETTVRVWEVVQWVKDTLVAAKELETPPLDFHGRALQIYHGDSATAGRRVERVQIPADLSKVGITFMPCSSQEPQALGTLEHVTDITGLEFIGKDGSRTTMGSTPSSRSGLRSTTPRRLAASLGRYHYAKLYKGLEPSCPFQESGIRVQWSISAFHGFHFNYNAQGIYSIGVLHSDKFELAQSHVIGYDAAGCRGFDMGLDEVFEVVATWEV